MGVRRSSFLHEALMDLGLFGTGCIIMLLFLYHPFFYNFDPAALTTVEYNPVVIPYGGFVMAVVGRFIIFLIKEKPHMRRGEVVMVFSALEMEEIVYGTRRTVIRRARRTRLSPGTVVLAKISLASPQPFARLRVKDLTVKTVRELTSSELLREGVKSMAELINILSERWGLGYDEVLRTPVRVIEFEVLTLNR